MQSRAGPPHLAWGRDVLGLILAGRERSGAGVGLLLPDPNGSPHFPGSFIWDPSQLQ